MAEVITETIIPGTYIEVRAEGLIAVGGIVTGRIGIVGTAARGPLNDVVSLSNYTQAKDIFSEYDAWSNSGSSPLTLVRALEQAFNNGASDVRAVRVGGAMVASASAVLKDIGDQDQVRVMAMHPGKWADGGLVKVEKNVKKKVKRFTVLADDIDSTKTAPFSGDLTELQLEHTNLVKSDGNDGELVPADISIKNLSQSPVKEYTLGSSLASNETFTVDSDGRRDGIVEFGAPQTEGDILEVTYHIIKRTVISNEKKNVAGSTIQLDRTPVDPERISVWVGTQQFKVGGVAGPGVFSLAGDTLTFPSSVPQGSLASVTYRYAPISRVTLTLPTGQKEEYEVENARDLTDVLAAKAARNQTEFTSKIIANPENEMNTGEMTLSGGNNGEGASAAQYKDGLTFLENEDVNLVLGAGMGVTQFSSALLGHVDSMETQGKDRIGLIGSEAGDDADAIKGHTETLSYRRMILVAPGIKVTDSTASRQQGRDVVVTLSGGYAAAAVAGKLASLAPHHSPTNKVIAVRGVVPEFFRAEIKELIQNRVLCLEKKSGFRVVRGITTDPGAFAQVSVRRTVDKAKAGIRTGSMPYIGKLNNERVRKALKATLDGFLTSMVAEESLVSYQLEVSATRPQEIAGKCIVTVTLRPTFSIDYIVVTMNLE